MESTYLVYAEPENQAFFLWHEWYVFQKHIRLTRQKRQYRLMGQRLSIRIFLFEMADRCVIQT